jgi:hypothetical protein
MNDILQFCVDNPDKTVEDIMKIYKITQSNAFYFICEAGKKLQQNEKTN